jgi:rubrerythrin
MFAKAAISVIETQIHQKLPTLVVKLQKAAANKQPHRQGVFSRLKKVHKSDQELDHLLESSMDEFKRELKDNIDGFHQQMLSVKPHPFDQQRDPDGYDIRMNLYQELLRVASEIIKRMQQSFTAILNSYRDYIERLWEAIQDGHDVLALQRQFEQQLRLSMDRYWAPVFKKADEQLVCDFDANLGDAERHTPVSSAHHQ